MTTPRLAKSVSVAAFTLVELLIVIVVIVILASLTIVAYDSVQRNAAESVVKSDLAGAAKEIIIKKSKTGCPLNTDNIPKSSTTIYVNYSCQEGAGYCIQANHTRYTDISYYVDNGGKVAQGVCVM
jgi:prepilin-type N-terminal cleavage/methylation domain-containing protein